MGDTLGQNRSLTSQLLHDLGGPGQPITTLTNANVDDELGNSDLPHDILGGGGLRHFGC